MRKKRVFAGLRLAARLGRGDGMSRDRRDIYRQHKAAHDAYVAGDMAALRAALDDPPDFPNCRQPFDLAVGDHPLEYAIYWSPLAFIEQLLGAGRRSQLPGPCGLPVPDRGAVLAQSGQASHHRTAAGQRRRCRAARRQRLDAAALCRRRAGCRSGAAVAGPRGRPDAEDPHRRLHQPDRGRRSHRLHGRHRTDARHRFWPATAVTR